MALLSGPSHVAWSLLDAILLPIACCLAFCCCQQMGIEVCVIDWLNPFRRRVLREVGWGRGKLQTGLVSNWSQIQPEPIGGFWTMNCTTELVLLWSKVGGTHLVPMSVDHSL
jgi:hypothetical protein